MPAIFTAAGQTVTLSRPAELGNGETWGRIQARGRTQDGEFMAADKGNTVRQFHLAFRELTDADKANLEAFVDDYAVGSTIDVTFTDHDGAQWIVRFLNDRLEWTEDWASVAGRHRVAVDLEVIRRVSVS